MGRRRRQATTTGIASAAVALVLLTAGCTDAPGGQEAPSVDGASGIPSAAPPTPFSGPWAELFTSTYAEVSDAERQALEDGGISELEYSYFEERILSCLDDLGVEASFATDRALEYSNRSGASEEHIDACLSDNGIKILTLSDAISRNPENRDEATIMTECLQRVGLVDRGYTPADYDAGTSLADIVEDDDFVGCTADPLHYPEE